MESHHEGTGLTRARITKITEHDCIQDPNGVARIAKEYASNSSATSQMKICVEENRVWLKSIGMPSDEDRAVIWDHDGNWKYAPANWSPPKPPFKGSRHIGRASAYIQSLHERDTQEWFAAEIIFYDRIMKIATTEDARLEAAVRLKDRIVNAAWKFTHEAAANEGYTLQRGRKRGQAAGAEGARRKGNRRRGAIVKAARLLCAETSDFLRNDSELARQIHKMNLRELRDKTGGSMGVSGIRKHISAARRSGELSIP